MVFQLKAYIHNRKVKLGTEINNRQKRTLREREKKIFEIM